MCPALRFCDRNRARIQKESACVEQESLSRLKRSVSFQHVTEACPDFGNPRVPDVSCSMHPWVKFQRQEWSGVLGSIEQEQVQLGRMPAEYGNIKSAVYEASAHRQ
jgi:hypothetical protein